ncbi:MAG: metallophosphoesterase [Phreatobacter sp.]|uniref:metallophosphoesterase n=1 Tax=Phreatobacter sp. TaxID=1966341 RepID=UPI00273417AF|nr:metallophosphoesterase [Phreatobacter sp.]MDP2800774.1 metallophosphoesterase [Phreatobacter sp.]
MEPLVDPRRGDAEDDASSPATRSFIKLAGSLFAEISLPKLIFAWTSLILVPGLLLGAAPLVVTGWVDTLSGRITALAGFSSVLLLLLVAVVGWVGWRPLFRSAERSFWSLNALAIQPGYATSREALRHVVERLSPSATLPAGRARLRSLSAIGAAALIAVAAIGVILLVWPSTRWTADFIDFARPNRLVRPALANAVVLVAVYMAIASISWGYADSTMAPPVDLEGFDLPAAGGRSWRVAHLSDLHVVGERYGFRIECGRRGPRGNGRLVRILERLAALHAAEPLDLIMVTGDTTDAGRSAEWAEFLDLVSRHPELAARMLLLPGNHDLNIVDRANPARLDVPFSPAKQLRRLRTLSAMVTLQGDRVRLLNRDRGVLGQTLAAAAGRKQDLIHSLAETASLGSAVQFATFWDNLFPLVMPPATDDGLGVILLNSNAETHFSFTNALGLVSHEQEAALAATIRQYPRASWIVALHHHLIEYPRPARAFFERVGTALVNGSWFVRQLDPLGDRLVVMHGHRHVDWIGQCGAVRIVSAPSPVMVTDEAAPSVFYLHGLSSGAGAGPRLRLAEPEQIIVQPEAPSLASDWRDAVGTRRAGRR